jgi:hypothetical protein
MKTVAQWFTAGGVVLSLTLTGCVSDYQLRARAILDANDDTVVAPALSAKKYTRIMVIPPSGTARGQYDKEIALFEREFLKGGLTVISGAITGRVVLDPEGSTKGKSEAAAHLSDAERALVMAKETGADAILQIGQFEWAEGTTRYFLANSSDKTHREVRLDEFRAAPDENKIALTGHILRFVGRLTDVQTGMVLASFKIESATNWNLPTDYIATIRYVKPNAITVEENLPYNKMTVRGGVYQAPSRIWEVQARDKTTSQVIQQIAKRIAGP